MYNKLFRNSTKVNYNAFKVYFQTNLLKILSTSLLHEYTDYHNSIENNSFMTTFLNPVKLSG